MSQYVPKPIDTSAIKLTPRQAELIERLAVNVHEVWAQKRVEDGWRFGPSRNDDLKTHPGIVPYEALTESEKDYDRVMVEQVVRAAVALGYRID
jgi:RyR domain